MHMQVFDDGYFSFIVSNVCLSEGFVAGVGPQGAYTAELSLDQSKVKKSSGLEKTEDEKFNCLFDSNEEFMTNVLVGGGEQPLPYGHNKEGAHSGFQKFFVQWHYPQVCFEF